MSSNTQTTSGPGFHAISHATGADMAYSDLAFVTTHPPDVSPRSRIVAVCGISDDGDLASPGEDGQIWLTCEEPQHLIEKYGEYAHGDPRNERRIVLDKHLLSGIDLAGNLHVVPKAILLERFVKTVEEQAAYAKRDGQHLIILIFAHGQQNPNGTFLGSEDETMLLNTEHLQRAIPRGTKVTLMLTSCYSGGWLVQPELGHRRLLNATGIAASGPEDETKSWSLSRSAGRACGSTIATAILNELIQIEEAAGSDNSPQSHPTYIDLATSIYDRAISLDTFFADQNVHFSAQDDDWEAHWRARVGTPLVQYKARWEMLRQVAPSGTGFPNANSTPSNRRLGSLKKDLGKLSREYFAANPGRDSLASNVSLHSGIAQVLIFETPMFSTVEKIQSLLNKILYRLNAMKETDEYVQAMGLEFPSCLGYNIETQFRPSAAVQARRDFAYKHLLRVRIFPSPVAAVRPALTKPSKFLAIALAERCSSQDEIEEKVEKALEWRKLRANNLLPYLQAHKIMNESHIRSKLKACFAGLRDAGHRLYVKAQVMTPSHQGYTAVSTDEIPTF
ncbi:hypothetical protein P175DRAFT_0554889 [Aspergillus ochraceoroseus IBT 24754]|uniref:Uncharacterized protein n=1 Tax=Aspergillus ochraceoroseus IBT 24754 TaxID=1392256 RepID=A0A2T5MAV3_9EURO|nr:uncharacterized protein P175DRAFT_0554889 [Aspergillus ochraceoroseus IBT 24754]PTU25657.1 hypothetical protein P175DRAFT_0554889 [Aspergillus ochraceoroseus IBT 24754]